MSGSKYAKGAHDFGPEPPFILLRESLARDRDGLAGEARRDYVYRLDVLPADGAEVAAVRDVGEPLGENGLAGWFDLGLPARLVASGFEAEVETAASRAERADRPSGQR